MRVTYARFTARLHLLNLVRIEHRHPRQDVVQAEPVRGHHRLHRVAIRIRDHAAAAFSMGDSMAGATAWQCIAACLALYEGVLPPTINYEEPDPELDLDYVPNRARKKDIQIAMANCFGLGGTNVVMAFGKG